MPITTAIMSNFINNFNNFNDCISIVRVMFYFYLSCQDTVLICLTYYAQYYAYEKLVPNFVPSGGLTSISQKCHTSQYKGGQLTKSNKF